MKFILLFLVFILPKSSFACLLLEGKIIINKSEIIIHQKFTLGERYPYRTKDNLVHLELLKQKILDKQILQITVLHPKTMNKEIEGQVFLEENKNEMSEFSKPELIVSTQFKLKKI